MYSCAVNPILAGSVPQSSSNTEDTVYPLSLTLPSLDLHEFLERLKAEGQGISA